MKKYLFKRFLLLTIVLTIGSTAAHAQLKTVTRGFNSFGLTHLQPFPSGELDANISFATERNLSSDNPIVNTTSGILVLYPGASGTTNGGNSLVLTPKNNVAIIEVSLSIRTGGTLSQNAVYKADGSDYQAIPASSRTISDIQAKQQVVITNSDATRSFAPMSITVTYLEGTTPLLLTGDPLSFSIRQGAPSPVKSLPLRAYNLTPADGNITLTLPDGFEASINEAAYAGTLNIPYTEGALLNTAVNIRLKEGLAVGSYSGNLEITGGGVSGQVALKGIVTPETGVNVTGTIVTVTNLRAGGLQDALVAGGVEATGMVTELTLSGHMNAADFGYLRNNYRTKITKMDLSGIAAIEAYSGTEGPGAPLENNYPEGELPYWAFYQYSVLTTAVLPDNAAFTSIGREAFRNARALPSLHIPGSVKSIGNGAFFGALELSEIRLPSGLEWLGGSNTFNNASALTSLEIPAGTKIMADTNGKYVLDNTFNTTTSLASVNIPSNVTEIGALAFANTGLISVKIPEGVTTIGQNAFLNAAALKTIDLPSTLDNIGENAFNGAVAVETIIVRNPEPFIFTNQRNVFNGINKETCILYVPEGTVDIYKEFDLWKDFNDIREIGADAEEGGEIDNFENITVEVGSEPIILAAKATIGEDRPITYTIQEGKEAVAILEGNMLTIVGEGVAEITALAEGDNDYQEAKKTITLTVVSYDWLQAPAIAVHGSTAKVVGPEDAVTAFTKFYIGPDEVTDFNNDNGADLTGKTGTIELKVTDEDGAQVIRLVISKN